MEGIVKEKIVEAGITPTPPVVNVLTDITADQNREQVPNPDVIVPNQQLKVPDSEIMSLIADTLQNPHVEAKAPKRWQLFKKLKELNGTRKMSKQEKMREYKTTMADIKELLNIN